MTRPYRIINSVELAQLQHLFNQRITQWSDAYSINPLAISLIQPAKMHEQDAGLYLRHNQHIAAILPTNYLDTLAHWLFGLTQQAYHNTTASLSSLLFNQLFESDYSQISSLDESPDWFYPGSTCLLLIISDGITQCTCTLAPYFVHELLPIHQQIDNLGSLEEALTGQTVALNLELTPLNVPIEHLLSLSPGDVLTTNHPLTAPLKLMQGTHLLSEAELGQSSNYKSIILKGAL
ncbi:MAG: FliM/FliN family flagellar motor C-terminal domain-containing protein [Legionella sp.]